MLRRVIYTTNSIETASYQLRKVTKNRGHFPSDEAVVKLPKAGDLRHLWTNEPENVTRRKDCHHPSAKPRADSSKDRSPPTRYKALAQPRHRIPQPNQPPPVNRLHRNLDRLSARYHRGSGGGWAQDMGITVGYLPGLSMRRIADLTPGSAKTDAKDAAVIAGAARTMPHTLRAVSASDEDAAALSMLTGFDLDLARQVNQTANRIPGPVVHPDPAQPSRPWWGPGRAHDAAVGGPSPPGPLQPI